MKKIIACFLSLTMFLTGCGAKEEKKVVVEGDKLSEVENMNFTGLNDPTLTTYLEDSIYESLIKDLNSDEYFIENVKAKYVSQEYLEELEYNSQSNIFFGYTLDELYEIFEDDKFVFTLDEDGKTTVKDLEAVDEELDKLVKQAAIGGGIILVCVTVGMVAAPTAPAVSMIFMTAAESSTSAALSGAAIEGAMSALITGYETKDVKKALKAGVTGAGEGFMIGAIAGSLSGGIKSASALHGAKMNGLTMNQAAKIQQDSGWSLDLIKNIHSEEEYQVYKQLDLEALDINGKKSLVQKVDWDLIPDLEDGRTNAQRVLDGLNPIGDDGKSFNVHHVGQKQDSPFALLTDEQHKIYYSEIHANMGQSPSLVDHGNKFNKEKKEFFKELYRIQKGEVLK